MVAPGDAYSGGGGARAEEPGRRPVTRRPHRAIVRTEDGAPDLQGLAARAVEGDAQAVESLLGAVHRLVHRYCRARLARFPGAEHAADDVAQEVCIAVLSALPRYRDEGKPFEAFVYRIAANKVADVQRWSYRTPTPQAEIPDVIDLTDGPEASLAPSAFGRSLLAAAYTSAIKAYFAHAA